MLQPDNRSTAELLLRLSEFGQLVSSMMAEATQDTDLVANRPITVMCRMALYGPLRPSEVMDATGLSSGGATKLIDRLEAAGWVQRMDDPVPEDGRGVLVALTPRGGEHLDAMVGVLATRLGETETLVKEINQYLEG